MKRLSVFAVLLALFAGTAATLHSNRAEMLVGPNPAMLNSSAAFRDGLYFGRLASQQGGPAHIANGRWAKSVERGLFTAGFQQGYNERKNAQVLLVGGRQPQ